jgi:hypothetical protein
MPELSSWDVISDAGQGEVILAVDFPSVGRPEAGFTDLAGNIGSQWSEYSVLQTIPAGGRIERSTSGQQASGIRDRAALLHRP